MGEIKFGSLKRSKGLTVAHTSFNKWNPILLKFPNEVFVIEDNDGYATVHLCSRSVDRIADIQKQLFAYVFENRELFGMSETCAFHNLLVDDKLKSQVIYDEDIEHRIVLLSIEGVWCSGDDVGIYSTLIV